MGGAALGVLALGLLAGCAGLPPPAGRVASSAMDPALPSALASALAPQAAAHPGLSGIHGLPDGRDAFAARVLLAQAAQRSLDVQYYIWHGDETGDLLFEALWLAAGRGVRVRLLVDDNNTGGLDPTLAALDAHPQIEVRLYNSVVHRGVRALNYLTDFSRVNRRMHNKSFTADNQVSVVGGRNIGNEYFGAGDGVAFADLDVMAVGAAVPAVSAAFDRYWNSASAYPAAALLGPPPSQPDQHLRLRFAENRARPATVRYAEELRNVPFVDAMLQGKLAFEWGRAQVLADDPAKTLQPDVSQEVLMLPALAKAIGEPQRRFDLVSPYLVLGEHGTQSFVDMARRGVQVRMLTNSLSSTDVGAVHAGYAKRRLALLAAGVKLYEIKPSAMADAAQASAGRRRLGSSSSASLHAKTFAVDGRHLFVGSFNFDPRSALLNTEMGLVVDHPLLAGQLVDALNADLPLIAYEVQLQADGSSLAWIERTPQGEQRHTTEPGTSWARRLGVSLMSVLPIDWLL